MWPGATGPPERSRAPGRSTCGASRTAAPSPSRNSTTPPKPSRRQRPTRPDAGRTMRRRAHAAALVAILGLGGAPARSEDPPVRAASDRAFDQFVRKTLADYAVPGGVVAVVRADGTAFVQG